MITFISIIMIVLDMISLVYINKNKTKYGSNKLTLMIFFLILWLISNACIGITTDINEKVDYSLVSVLTMTLCLVCMNQFFHDFFYTKFTTIKQSSYYFIFTFVFIVISAMPSTKNLLVYATPQGIKYGYLCYALYIFIYALDFVCVFIIFDTLNKIYLTCKKERMLFGIMVFFLILYDFTEVFIYHNYCNYTPIFSSFGLLFSYSILSKLTYNVMKKRVVKEIIDGISSRTIAYDRNGFVIFCSKLILSKVSVSEQRLLGLNILNKDLVLELFGETAYNIVSNEQDDFICEIYDGNYRCKRTPIYVNNKQIGTALNFLDVSEEVIRDKELEHISTTDRLTGLKNLHAFEIALSQTPVDENEKLAIITLDINNFKLINDIFGLNTGDLCLIKLATRLKNEFLENAIGVYRVGSDDFCIITKEVDTFVLKNKIKNIVDLINNNNSFFISISAGCVISPKYTKNISTNYLYAIEAMKISKKSKGEFTVFNNELFLNYESKVEMEEDFLRGVNAGEITAFLQPKYNMKTNEVDGAEALVRWNHREHGIISPFKFLGIAEELGILATIDLIVLEKSVEAISMWEKKYNKHIHISSNLSLVSMVRPSIATEITEILDKYKVLPENITLELLEDQQISEFNEIGYILEKLSKTGVNFAIDDFGSGYSNFDTLKKIDVDFVKIDKTLIDDVVSSPTSARTVGTLCELIKNFNCIVIVEGVESAEQVEVLKDFDIDYIQGYYYGKPISIESFENTYIASN